MWYNLLKTTDSLAPTLVRVVLGIVLFAHGAQKMLGWFGGHGFSATMQHFTEGGQLPWIVAFTVILTEFLGSLLLIVGFLTRFAAVAVTVLFVGIIFTAHLGNGFFMNWSGAQSGEGYEYHLLVIAMAVSLIVTGAGRYSADEALTALNRRGGRVYP